MGGGHRRFYQEQLKERFLADWQPPAARWEQMRDRLVFVHDRLSEERLEALCLEQESDDDWNLLGARSLSDGTVSPREAFARWNARIPTERRYERIGELSEPLPADVYLSPNGED